MAIQAVILGLGAFSFLILYACFNISAERYMEKAFLFYFGLTVSILIPVALLMESTESASSIAYFTPLFSAFVVVCVSFLVTMLGLYAYHMIEKRAEKLTDDEK